MNDIDTMIKTVACMSNSDLFYGLLALGPEFVEVYTLDTYTQHKRYKLNEHNDSWKHVLLHPLKDNTVPCVDMLHDYLAYSLDMSDLDNPSSKDNRAYFRTYAEWCMMTFKAITHRKDVDSMDVDEWVDKVVGYMEESDNPQIMCFYDHTIPLVWDKYNDPVDGRCMKDCIPRMHHMKKMYIENLKASNDVQWRTHYQGWPMEYMAYLYLKGVSIGHNTVALFLNIVLSNIVTEENEMNREYFHTTCTN